MSEERTSPDIKYNLFISYSTDPDYQLSRRVEAFLESFHKLKTPKDVVLKQLMVCRDGSDFSLHAAKKQVARNVQGDETVNDVLANYLQQSQYLLVLCSKNSALSKYVQFEIDWFLRNRGEDFILLAVTEGNNIPEEEKQLFSEKVLQHKLQTKIFYDLRGFKKEAKHWRKVRDHNEELTNIAAFLNNETTGKILPLWQRQERQKLKRQRFVMGAAAVIFLFLAIVAFFLRQTAVRNERMALENLKKFRKEEFKRNMRNGMVYFNAKEFVFAYNEFLAADSVVYQYPDDPDMLSQKEAIKSFLSSCNNHMNIKK